MAMRWMRTVALLVAPLLIPSTVAARSNYAPGSLDRAFRLEWQTVTGGSGLILEGYVYNLTAMPAERMVLEIDLLDGAGNVVGQTSTRVLGGAPPGNRAWFQAKVPPAASYRVEVQSFDWVRVGGGA
jgi:hypothetical protein